MPAPKRILVAYYSLSGNTERAARDIAARLGADLERIRERTDRHGFLGYLRATLDSLRERPANLEEAVRHAGDYGLTIVGTPIWGGKMTPAIRAYLRSLRGRLHEVAFFTTSGATNGAGVIGRMQELLGREAVATVAFDERELRDHAAYSAKLDAFVAAIKSSGELSMESDAASARAVAR